MLNMTGYRSQFRLIFFILLMLFNVGQCYASPALNTPDSNKIVPSALPLAQAKNIPIHSDQDALKVANQFQATADTLRAEHNTILTPSSSFFTLSVIPKIKAIISVIELETKNVVNVVMGDSPSTADNTKALNDIVAHLEKQDQSLDSLTQASTNSAPTDVKSLINPPASDSFKVFANSN